MSRNIVAVIALLGLFTIPGGNADSEGVVPDACESLPILGEECRDALQDWANTVCLDVRTECYVCLEFNPGAEISLKELLPNPNPSSKVVSIGWIGVGPADGSFSSLDLVPGSYILSAGLDDFDGCMNVR